MGIQFAISLFISFHHSLYWTWNTGIRNNKPLIFDYELNLHQLMHGYAQITTLFSYTHTHITHLYIVKAGINYQLHLHNAVSHVQIMNKHA